MGYLPIPKPKVNDLKPDWAAMERMKAGTAKWVENPHGSSISDLASESYTSKGSIIISIRGTPQPTSISVPIPIGINPTPWKGRLSPKLKETRGMKSITPSLRMTMMMTTGRMISTSTESYHVLMTETKMACSTSKKISSSLMQIHRCLPTSST